MELSELPDYANDVTREVEGQLGPFVYEVPEDDDLPQNLIVRPPV